MATFTPNFSLTMPDYAEPADIAVLNGNTSQIDSLIYQGRRMAVGGYDSTATYNTGDLVEYANALYRCKEDNVTGNWDSTKWELTTLADEIASKGEGGADVTKEVSGNPVEFEDGADAPLVKCVSAITGSQDLHGYDKPWVGGAGKNKLPMTVDGIKANNTGTWSGNSLTVNGVTFTILTDSGGNVTGIKATGTASANADLVLVGLTTLTEGNIINGSTGGSGSTYGIGLFQIGIVSGNADHPISSSEASINRSVYIRIISGYAIPTVGITFYPMIRLSTESDPTFAPYSNICPITAYNQSTISVEDENEVVQQTSTATFSNSIYQGNADFVGGSATANIVKVDLGAMVWKKSTITPYVFYTEDVEDYKFATNTEMICSAYNHIGSKGGSSGLADQPDGSFAHYYQSGQSYREIYFKDTRCSTLSEFEAVIVGVQLAYELATPTTSSITPTNLPIKSLFGYNRIESSTGDMEIEYITEEFQPLVDLIEANASEPYSDDYTLDTEIEVGKWVDGSTLYRKTKEITGNKNAGYEGTIYTAGSGEHIVKLDGCIYNDYYSGMAYPINMTYPSNNGTMAFSTWVTGSDAETVLFRNGWNSAISKIYLVVYYIKSSS